MKNNTKTIAFSEKFGVLWDTVYSLHIQHNTVHFREVAEKNADVAEELNTMEQYLQPVTFAETAPFFYRLNGGMSFMLLYISKYLDAPHAAEDLTVKAFWTYLQNDEKLVTKLLMYYFPALTEAEAEALKSSPKKAVPMIREAQGVDSEIKIDLMDIILNEEQNVQKLLGEILNREPGIKELRAKRAAEFADLQLSFDAKKVADFLKNDRRIKLDVSIFPNWFVTFTLFPMDMIKLYWTDDQLLLLLGTVYQNTIEQYANLMSKVNLQVVGAALAEKNRLEFLDYLLEKGEATGKDIERDFHLTGTNTYYHLSYLTRAGLLQTRSRGRNIVYSIDPEAIRAIKECLSKYEG